MLHFSSLKRFLTLWWTCGALACSLVSSEQISYAGVLELSGTFSFSQSNIGDSNFQWSRRWSLGVGYYIGGTSEIEFGMMDVLNRTKIAYLEDTTFHDEVYSLHWVQYFASRSSMFVPYAKLGAGQLNREATGMYWAGGAPPARYGSLTAVLGVGLKLNVYRSISLRAEGTSYLSGAVLSTWQDNFSINFGASIYL